MATFKRAVYSDYAANQLFRSARENKGLSQKQLASKIGYSNSQIVSNWERGVVAVPTTRAKQLCKVLGVSVSTAKRAFVSDYEKTLSF